MRASTAIALAAALWLLLPDRPVSAQDKSAPKWEYAELSFRGSPARPAGKDSDGNEVPASAGTLNLRWAAGSDEFAAKEWSELAEKLKLTIKKDSSATSQKMQVLNGLGTAGWELVDRQITTPGGAARGFGQPGGGFGQPGGISIPTTNMLFKRRVP